MKARILILTLILFLGIALVGCKQGEQITSATEPKDNPVMETDDAAPAGEIIAPNAEEKTEEPKMTEPEDSEELTDNKFDMFKGLLDMAPNYRVVYDYSTSQGVTEMTQYFKDGNMRTDVIAEGIESRTYMVGNLMTSCNKATGSWMCFEIDTDTARVETGLEDIEENPDEYASKVKYEGSETVAGESTECYLISEEDWENKYCINSQGIALKMQGVSANEKWSMIAIEFSTDVSDSDFEVPESETVNVDDMMKNMPQMPG